MPIVGHAYVGGAFNILRGAIYTAGAAVLIIYGSNQNFDEGVPAILLGIGVCIISAVDAVISTNNYNKKLKSEGFSLNLIAYMRLISETNQCMFLKTFPKISIFLFRLGLQRAHKKTN